MQQALQLKLQFNSNSSYHHVRFQVVPKRIFRHIWSVHELDFLTLKTSEFTFVPQHIKVLKLVRFSQLVYDISCLQSLSGCIHTYTQTDRQPKNTKPPQRSYRHSYAFSRTFQDLERPNSRVFQDSKILFFQDFPGNVPFKTLVARGQKVHIQNQLSMYLH